MPNTLGERIFVAMFIKVVICWLGNRFFNSIFDSMFDSIFYCIGRVNCQEEAEETSAGREWSGGEDGGIAGGIGRHAALEAVGAVHADEVVSVVA